MRWIRRSGNGRFGHRASNYQTSQLLIFKKEKSHLQVIARVIFPIAKHPFREAIPLLAADLRAICAGACFIGENTLLAMTFGLGHSLFKSQ